MKAEQYYFCTCVLASLTLALLVLKIVWSEFKPDSDDWHNEDLK